MSLLEQQEQEMMLALCLTGFCSAEAGKNPNKYDKVLMATIMWNVNQLEIFEKGLTVSFLIVIKVKVLAQILF